MNISASSAIVSNEIGHDSQLEIWQEPWADWRFRLVYWPRNKDEEPVVGYMPHTAVRGYLPSVELEPREYAGPLGPPAKKAAKPKAEKPAA